VGSNQFVQEVHHPKQWRHRSGQANQNVMSFLGLFITGGIYSWLDVLKFSWLLYLLQTQIIGSFNARYF